MAKKKLKDLTEKDKRRLGIKTPTKLCSCEIAHPRIESNELFESWEICTKCNKEVI
jgi:transcription initiation factor IIE alpha subunit